ncbi:MAG: hypothetical protein HS105_11070 [Chloracidobacterium sp.]|nr:hypothetical protein [Chloracidobacterium sp.]MCC6824651.1 hypothetical protein [Acidobacteriota bacterium]MCO5332805.1 hypothetical protein [Pyrinomonadaceae bacterium]
MFTAKKINFSKNEDCPPSDELLDFQNGEMSVARGLAVCAHLAICDFCSAEVEFYSRYPQAKGEAVSDEEPAAIPGPLYELAEAILNDSRSPDILNSLLQKKAGK